MAIPEGVTTQVWIAVCAIAAPLLLGLGLVRTLGLTPVHGWRLSLAFAYLTGHGALAIATTVWLILGQPVPGWLLPAAAAACGWWLVHGSGTAASRPRTPIGSWLPVVLLAAALSIDCLRTNADPVRFGDEGQIWAAKAKVLYASPSLDLAFTLPRFVQHADYPLFDPLVQTLAFASAGRVLHFENRLPIQFFGVALLLLLSAAMTRRSHPLAAALVLIVFMGTQFVAGATTVYADTMLALATLGAVEALLRLRETGECVWWRLAMVAFGAMLSTKNEGSLLALAVGAPFAMCWLFDRRAGRRGNLPRRELVWLAAPAAAIALHRGFNASFGLHNDLTQVGPDGLGLLGRVLHHAGERGPEVLSFYARMLVDPAAHRLLPLLFAAAVAVRALTAHPRWRGSELVMLAVVTFAILGYAAVFVGTTADLRWHMDTAAARTLQHVVPIAALGLCATAWPRRDTAAASGT